MTSIAGKIQRLREAIGVVGAHAADLRSAALLASCYVRLLRGSLSDSDLQLRLRIAGRRIGFTMRYSDIFTLGEILYEEQYRLEVSLPDHPVILDAGANIGAAAAWFQCQYPDAEIHCFEPSSVNFRYLKANFGGSATGSLHQVALGAEAGTVTLHLSEHGAMHSVVGQGNEGAMERVTQTTLSDFLSTHQIAQVDLLKLDVEGSELDVLRGLGGRIANVQHIIGEVHQQAVDVDAFYSYLGQSGFTVLWRRAFRDGEAEGVHGFEAVRRGPSDR